MKSGFGQASSGTRAGPNKQGGLQTKYSTDLVFNPDEPHIIYNVPFLIFRPSALPPDYQPGLGPNQPQNATWYHPGGSLGAPWPGLGPDPRITGAYVPPAPAPLAYSPEEKAQLIASQQAAATASNASTNTGIMITAGLLLLIAVGGTVYFFILED